MDPVHVPERSVVDVLYADLMREFHVVDANHNGRLTKEEIKNWLD